MAAHQRVKLPDICAGPIAEGIEAQSCPNRVDQVLIAVIPDDKGRPLAVLVGACRWHLADVRIWLELQTLPEDDVDAYPIDRVPVQLLENAGLDWHTLGRTA